MDRIFLGDLRLSCTIGVNERERTILQPVKIELDLDVDLRDAGTHDDLSLTVDYREIRDRIERIVSGSSFFLVEALAERIAQECLSHPRVLTARVCVQKPGALRATETVGVEVIRSRL